MPGLRLKSVGNWSKTFEYLDKITNGNDAEFFSIMKEYGERGVSMLQMNTPIDTGKTAESWSYRIVKNNYGYSLEFVNSNTTSEGTPIAILLQYGHGTRNGGYVQGRDYINPSIQPEFDRLADELYQQVR